MATNAVGRNNCMGRTPTTYPPRRTLPAHLATALAVAKVATGLTFRGLEQLSGIDNSYIVKLTKGTRCPSREVAEELIDALGLDDDVALELMEVAVVKRYYYPPRNS